MVPHTIKGRESKSVRLEIRLNSEQKKHIEHAAKLRGQSVSRFVIFSAHEAATATIKESRALSLRDEARDVFVNALLNPPAPSKILRSAARRYKECTEP